MGECNTCYNPSTLTNKPYESGAGMDNTPATNYEPTKTGFLENDDPSGFYNDQPSSLYGSQDQQKDAGDVQNSYGSEMLFQGDEETNEDKARKKDEFDPATGSIVTNYETVEGFLAEKKPEPSTRWNSDTQAWNKNQKQTGGLENKTKKKKKFSDKWWENPEIV